MGLKCPLNPEGNQCSINLSLVHSQESQAHNAAGDMGTTHPPHSTGMQFLNQVAVVNVVLRAQQQPKEHMGVPCTPAHVLTSNMGLALSWTDRMWVTLFLLNCSASLASVTEEKDGHVITLQVTDSSSCLARKCPQNDLHLSFLKLHN